MLFAGKKFNTFLERMETFWAVWEIFEPFIIFQIILIIAVWFYKIVKYIFRDNIIAGRP